MHTFDLVVVGAGGGIDETDLSAYLLKPADAEWSDGIVALEAGSGQGALRRILAANPTLFGDESLTVADIYSWVQSFVLSHPHLDHINSLVIAAGSSGGDRKRIYGTKELLDVLRTHIFQGLIWPDLASYNEEDECHKYLLQELRTGLKYKAVHQDISVRRLPVSHGSSGDDQYESSAFFIRHDSTRKEFLFFGDVEPDSIARHPRNIHIWADVARKFPADLSTIFIECSFPSGRQTEQLYGHLSPEHLIDELTVLAEEVVKQKYNKKQTRRATKRRKLTTETQTIRGALTGLRVVIIHCKDDMRSAIHPRQLILDQVTALVKEKGLGAEIIAAKQGMRISL